ncbi:MAG: SGNH/GDSL hydrolase family protein [Clostridia bacterium]|nr:SGNH/GDSL hydrolase family protein [Clostridia bacterium]
MKILFLGDSITDMHRDKTVDDGSVFGYGSGYVFCVAASLYGQDPSKYTVINKGISGNRVVDLYARIKADVWNYEPDVLSILIGINDIWHELDRGDGVDLARFEKVYDMLLADTMERFPDMKIILVEPFVLKGSATEEEFGEFTKTYEYAKAVARIAEKRGVYLLPMQRKFDEASEKYGVEPYLFDGVHPGVAGAALIAEEWLKLFKEKIDKNN